MKKAIFILMLFIINVVGTVSAADLMLEGNIAIWGNNTSVSANNSKDLEYEKVYYKNDISFFADFRLEHFVPLLPNVGVGYTEVNDKQSEGEITFNYIDVTGYYNLIDLTPITINAGVGAKIGNMKNEYGYASLKYDDVIPYLNASAKLDLLPTNFSIDADIKAMKLPSYDDTELFDGKCSLKWQFGGFSAKGEIMAGYRYLYLNQSMNKSNEVVTRIKGPFVGMGIVF